MSAFAPTRRRGVRGFTLIEVLISVLIFSVGILGAIGMQARAVQTSTQNTDRARASMLANEIASVMWAQQTTSITALSDYTTWQSRCNTANATGKTSGLPSGAGSVVVDSSGVATITVTWHPTSLASSSPDNKFVTTVVIP